MCFSVKQAVFAALTGILLSTACTEPEVPAQHPVAKTDTAQSSYITIIAAGDNLIHDIIYNRARISGSPESFDFTPSYEKIRPIIKSADIAFVNQETVLGGKEFAYSGYPVFNSPQEVGIGLVNAGFNVVNHASNHVMDKGEKAAFATMDFWESMGVPYLGIFRSEEKRNIEHQIIEKNGIKVGFLSYTYDLNGFPLPKDKPWMVGLIDREVIVREIDRLRPNCDFLVVSMHWGNEFQHTPSRTQKELAALMALHKVDLIIGHHPHVTSPVEVLERPDGGKLAVFYSLGDLLSHTQSDFTPDTITGALAYVKVKKTQQNGVSVCTLETAAVIPTVCHYNYDRHLPFVVYPLWDYTDELASAHYKSKMTLAYLKGVTQQVFGVRALEKEQFERAP